MFSTIKSTIWTLGVVALLSACGGGGGEPSATTQTIRVVPALGAFGAGATVKAYASDGTQLGSATTSEDGIVSALSIPKSHAGALILRVSGGSYFDEGKMATVQLGSAAMLSVVPADRVAAGAAFGITPLTNVVASLAGLDASSIAAPVLASSEDIDAALATFQLVYPVDLDVLSAPAPFKNAADMDAPKTAGDSSALYGVLLAEMARNATTSGTSALAQAIVLAQAARAASSTSDSTEFATQMQVVTAPLLAAADGFAASTLLSGTSDTVQSFALASTFAKAPADVFQKDLADLQIQKEAQSTQVHQSTNKLSTFQGFWRSDSDPSWTVAISAGGAVMALSQDANALIVGKVVPLANGYVIDGVQIANSNDGFSSEDVSVPVSVATDASAVLTMTVGDGAHELAAETRYNTPYAAAAAEGTWSQILDGYAKVTLAVDADGTISGTTSTGCTWTGSLSALPEAKALASALLTEICGDEDVDMQGLANMGGDGALNMLVYRNSATASGFLVLKLEEAASQ